MLLDLKDIIEVPGASVPFDISLDTERLSFSYIKEYKSAPTAQGRVSNSAGILTLEGSLSADTVCICDRCGKEFDRHRSMKLNAFISAEETDDPEAFVLDGDKLDLSDTISTLYVLDADMKCLCSEDCKGLCSRCGADLNLGPCGCRKEIDPRFAVLEQLLDK